MKLFSSKKGIFGSVWFFMLDLIILIIILLTLFNFVDNAAESTTFEKFYLSRDLALMTSTLYASPDCVTIKYPKNTFWFTYIFNDKVEVIDETIIASEVRIKKFLYPIVKDKTQIELTSVKLKPEKTIVKSDSLIERVFSPNALFFSNHPDQENGTFVDIYMCKEGDLITIADEEINCCGVNEIDK